jgi:hypothetical protein
MVSSFLAVHPGYKAGTSPQTTLAATNPFDKNTGKKFRILETSWRETIPEHGD